MQVTRLDVSKQKATAQRVACAAFVCALPANSADWSVRFLAPGLYRVLEQISENIPEQVPAVPLTKWSDALSVAASVLNVIREAKMPDGLVERLQWAGSLAKDTAVDKYDLDVVVILKRFNPDEYTQLLNQLEHLLVPELQAEVSLRSFYFKSVTVAKRWQKGEEQKAQTPGEFLTKKTKYSPLEASHSTTTTTALHSTTTTTAAHGIDSTTGTSTSSLHLALPSMSFWEASTRSRK
jgi:hypothetical protein